LEGIRFSRFRSPSKRNSRHHYSHHLPPFPEWHSLAPSWTARSHFSAANHNSNRRLGIPHLSDRPSPWESHHRKSSLDWPENLQWGYGRPPGISDTLEVPLPGTVEVTVTCRGRGNPGGGTVFQWTTELATKPVPPMVMITPVLPSVILTGKRYCNRSLQRTAS
jgi:hypothetical protein